MKDKLIYSEVFEIPIEEIESIDINPRTIVGKLKLQELAKTIKAVGLIHPITVYFENGKYHLVSGKRRYLAVKMNKKATIEARTITNELTDEIRQIIKDIQLIENAQREDVHPLEEAFAFSQFGYSTEEIALRIGKSIQYVQDRLNLLLLIDEVKKYFYEDIITLSHAMQLCKLTAPHQEIILNNILVTTGKGEDKKVVGVLSVSQTKNNILRVATVNLSNAKFDLKDKSICKDAGSCLKCLKRSGFNRNLFNDIEADDQCYDVSCFNKKSFNHALQVEQQLIQQGYNTVRLTALYNDTKQELQEKMLELDYLFYRQEIPLNQDNLIGIYFEHHKKDQIGEYCTVVPRTDEIEQVIKSNTKQRKESNIEIIKKEKAKKAVGNALLQLFGQKIGEYHCDILPTSIVRLLAFNYYVNMPEVKRIKIDEFYDFENNSNANAAFFVITKHFNYQNNIKFLLVCMIYDYIKDLDVKEKELVFIKELSLEWKIDIMPIIQKVESEFSVTLELLKK